MKSLRYLAFLVISSGYVFLSTLLHYYVFLSWHFFSFPKNRELLQRSINNMINVTYIKICLLTQIFLITQFQNSLPYVCKWCIAPFLKQGSKNSHIIGSMFILLAPFQAPVNTENLGRGCEILFSSLAIQFPTGKGPDSLPLLRQQDPFPSLPWKIYKLMMAAAYSFNLPKKSC